MIHTEDHITILGGPFRLVPGSSGAAAFALAASAKNPLATRDELIALVRKYFRGGPSSIGRMIDNVLTPAPWDEIYQECRCGNEATGLDECLEVFGPSDNASRLQSWCRQCRRTAPPRDYTPKPQVKPRKVR